MMIGAPATEAPLAVLVPLGAPAEAAAVRILADLRRSGLAADMAWRGNMKKRMARAASSGASFAILLGDAELESGTAQVKNLQSGEQRAVSLDLLQAALTA
jgi:histidyl-tRNA synthetase